MIDGRRQRRPSSLLNGPVAHRPNGAINMRWIWIDKFVEFTSGERAVAIKNLTMAEEHLHDHYPGFPVMPESLMIEGMAQTAGILVGEARDFREKVVLAKVKRAQFDGMARPGQQLRYEARMESLTDQGATTTGLVFCDGQEFGRIDLMFSHIDQNTSGLNFPKENFVFTEDFKNLLGTYRIDRASTAKSE